jgi:hypothetical protein
MKKLFYSFLVLFVLFSCKNESEINYDNFVLKFPMTVKEAKETLGLTYGCYSGFYKGNDNVPEISLQYENYPMFLGRDNDKEEDFLDYKVAGITFSYPFAVIQTDSLMKNLETIYKTKFEYVSTLEKAKYTENVDTMAFYKSKIDNNITLIIKEKSYMLIESKFTTLTVYYNLTDRELVKFVTYI